MATKSISINLPLNTPAIIIDVEQKESCFTFRIPSANQMIDFTNDKNKNVR